MPTPPQLNQPYIISQRIATDETQLLRVPSIHRHSLTMDEEAKQPATTSTTHCLNPASDINARLDTQVEVRVYPCNNNSTQGNKKKFTQFNVKPEVSRHVFRALADFEVLSQ